MPRGICRWIGLPSDLRLVEASRSGLCASVGTLDAAGWSIAVDIADDQLDLPVPLQGQAGRLVVQGQGTQWQRLDMGPRFQIGRDGRLIEGRVEQVDLIGWLD